MGVMDQLVVGPTLAQLLGRVNVLSLTTQAVWVVLLKMLHGEPVQLVTVSRALIKLCPPKISRPLIPSNLLLLPLHTQGQLCLG